MTTKQYRIALKKLGLTIVGAAPVIGISRRQAQRLAGGSPIPGPVSKLLTTMIDKNITPTEIAAIK